ncbi:PhnE/PtxC family ABC transporter permease [Clostridium saccharobutylicum]|uniref:Phosphonate ABC transporter, permease PhnE n=1 Tax=Clostridium saccharobutylicum DSM 13864 TaxID=1345695 RepID=U5MS30_CLOSA|nr:phosphate/phosphonate ABC transporter permease [Clostridium saccharobutylicum]AGX43385.1 phosphonate ABC transporter, permease PhnE [Clostridium saccharobutylicum DSM 13864]AQR90683.1 phosphate-import permease protein PhnE [Clostridium saccharobutylicum]AQS00587.1 phosphate-import permease protein PhnE [Clostridium saccharobutylicum]AQS10241.1 phosphate-import permease protein PhnE [Clostridium saccharobutylicum]AQS14570.1 phosphate-import permease protein PhnE [Clostridium saccharobutylicu
MKINILRKRNRIVTIIFITIIVFCMLCAQITQFSVIKGMSSVPSAIAWMFGQFIPNTKSFAKLPSILSKLIETILLSIASTTTASIIALFFGVMGSKVVKTNGAIRAFSRFIASISRNVPDAVWAMIFLLSFGQNILTGYLALFFASFGVLTRAFIETIDESSDSSVEALESIGASYPQIVFQSVLPSSLSQMISWILYMIETNIRSSTLIGILTGTGIGFIFDLYYKSMNYSVASLVVISIVLSVFAIEFISNCVRRKIL